jgi:hypothetical protein
MSTIQYAQFSQDERDDFESACARLGVEPGSFDVTAQEDSSPLPGGQYRIDRTVTVSRDDVSVEYPGATWAAAFEQNFNPFRSGS